MSLYFLFCDQLFVLFVRLRCSLLLLIVEQVTRHIQHTIPC